MFQVTIWILYIFKPDGELFDAITYRSQHLLQAGQDSWQRIFDQHGEKVVFKRNIASYREI